MKIFCIFHSMMRQLKCRAMCGPLCKNLILMLTSFCYHFEWTNPITSNISDTFVCPCNYKDTVLERK